MVIVQFFICFQEIVLKTILPVTVFVESFIPKENK